jgi:hypothetical protein
MAHTKAEVVRLEEGAQRIEMLRNESPFCDWSDALFGNFLLKILARDEGTTSGPP